MVLNHVTGVIAIQSKAIYSQPVGIADSKKKVRV